MRVLMISRDRAGLSPDSGTAKRWKRLAGRSVELDVVVVSRASGDWNEARVHVVGAGGGFFSRFFRAFKAAKRLVKQVDLISAQDPFELGFIAYLLAKKYRKPFEVQDHGGFFGEHMTTEPLWFLRKYLASFLIRRADSVRTVNPKSLKILKHLRNGRGAYLLPIAVADRFFHAEYKPESNMILTVARLTDVKRIDILLCAFAQARKQKPELKLTIVGEGPLRKTLEKLASDLRIFDAVSFAGFADPLPYYERASLFVLTSAHEGWGVAPVEAAVVGVPVLMTDTGCAEWLKSRGVAELIPVGADEAQIAERMLTLLEAAPRRNKLRSGVRMHETIERQAEAWRDVLHA